MGQTDNSNGQAQVLRATWTQTIVAILVLLAGIAATYSSIKSDLATVQTQQQGIEQWRQDVTERLNRIESRMMQRTP